MFEYSDAVDQGCMSAGTFGYCLDKSTVLCYVFKIGFHLSYLI